MANTDLGGADFEEVVAGPKIAGIGDNSQAVGLLIGPPLKDRVLLTHGKLFERAKALLEAEARIPKATDGQTLLCDSDDEERKMTELSKQLADCASRMDTARTAEIAPYRENLNLVHGMFREVMDKMEDPDNKTFRSLRHRLERALNAYKSRKKAAEDKRLADIAEKLRLEEVAAKKKRDDEAAALQAAEDARQKAAAEMARKAKEAADAAAAAANLKRNKETKAAADAEAKRLADIAAEAEQRRLEEQAQIDADRLARDEQTARDEAEAQRKRDEVEAQNAVPAAAVTRSRSSNAMSGQQEFVNYKDMNRETLDLDRIRSHIPSDALEQACRAYLKANNDMIRDEIKNRRQPVRGVTFFIDTRTQVR